MPGTLQFLGKQPGQPAVAGTVAGHTHCDPLLFVSDRNSGRRFLVDTGAEVSVIPSTKWDKINGNHGPTLLAANHTSINTYGRRTLPLIFNSRKFQWCFTIADVPQPLLGADFLRKYNLLVDINGKQRVDAHTFSSIPCGRVNSHAPHLAALSTVNNDYVKLLAEYPDITTPSFRVTSVCH